jgi:hypothetical protein
MDGRQRSLDLRGTVKDDNGDDDEKGKGTDGARHDSWRGRAPDERRPARTPSGVRSVEGGGFNGEQRIGGGAMVVRQCEHHAEYRTNGVERWGGRCPVLHVTTSGGLGAGNASARLGCAVH